MKIVRSPLAQIPPELIARLHQHSLFSSPGFMNLWRAQSGRPVVWLVLDQAQPVAVLPGVEFGRGLFKRFQAMPDGCYATLVPITDNHSLVDTAAMELIDAVRRRNYLRALINDAAGRFCSGFVRETAQIRTSVIRFEEPEWKPLDKKMQSEIRKAEREGIQVRPFNFASDWKRFEIIMQSTEARHGRRPHYSSMFYKELSQLAIRDSRVRWLFVEHDERAVASHINFVLGDTLLHWQSYSDRELSFLKANQYLIYYAANQAISEGLSYLNLGASPADAAGLQAYKRKFGAETVAYTQIDIRSLLGRIL